MMNYEPTLNYFQTQIQAASNRYKGLMMTAEEKRVLFINAVKRYALIAEQRIPQFEGLEITHDNGLPIIECDEKFITTHFKKAMELLTPELLLEIQIQTMHQLFELITEVLKKNELPDDKIQKLLTLQMRYRKNFITADREQLKTEIEKNSELPLTKRAFLAQYISEERRLLKEWRIPVAIALENLDLARVDFRRIELNDVEIRNCRLTDANLTNTHVAPEQLMRNKGFSKAKGLPLEVLAKAQQLKTDLLLQQTQNIRELIQSCLTSIIALDSLDKLICTGVPPALENIAEEVFAQTAFFALTSPHLNLLEKNPLSFDRVSAKGSRVLEEQGRGLSEQALLEMLQARNYQLSPEVVAVVQCSKLQVMTLPADENAGQIRDDVSFWIDDLTEGQKELLEREVAELQKLKINLRAQREQRAVVYEQHYINVLLANLHGDLYPSGSSPSERLELALIAAENNPLLVADVTECDLLDLDLRKFNLRHTRIRLSTNQRLSYLTEEQRGDRNEALREAIRKENDVLVDALLVDGVDVNSSNQQGSTALKIACHANNTKLVQILLEHEAQAEYETPGQQPIQIAAVNANRAMYDLLKEKGAQPDLQSAIKVNDANEAQRLLERVKDVNQVNNRGEIYLHTAIKYQAVEIVQWLVEERQADLHLLNESGQTALHVACATDNAVLVEFLLGHQSDVAKVDKRGRTALQLVMESLAEAIDARADDSFLRQKSRIAQLLLDKGAQLDFKGALLLDVAAPNIKASQVKKAFHANRIYRDAKQNTPLILAVSYNQEKLVNWLIEFKLNLEEENSQSENALSKACEKGYLSIVEQLECHRAKVNPENKAAKSPLFVAVEKGHVDIVGFLLEKGANVQTTWCENTALHSAVQQGRTDIVTLLLQYGADPFAKNSQGNLPIHLAAQTQRPDLVELLQEAYLQVKNRDGLSVNDILGHHAHSESLESEQPPPEVENRDEYSHKGKEKEKEKEKSNESEKAERPKITANLRPSMWSVGRERISSQAVPNLSQSSKPTANSC